MLSRKIYNFHADLLEFTYFLNSENDGKVTVEDGKMKTILVTTKAELAIEDKTFELKHQSHSWDCAVTLDNDNEPTLSLFEDKVPFDNLALAPSLGAYHSRNTKTNTFKGRVKKTSYLMFFDKNKIAIDCQYDEKNMVTALICGKKKEIRKGMKLKDRSQYPL